MTSSHRPPPPLGAIKAERQTRYRTSDGKWHDTPEGARRHEKFLTISHVLDQAGLGIIGQDMIDSAVWALIDSSRLAIVVRPLEGEKG